jgi:hypothetical protein
MLSFVELPPFDAPPLELLDASALLSPPLPPPPALGKLALGIGIPTAGAPPPVEAPMVG